MNTTPEQNLMGSQRRWGSSFTTLVTYISPSTQALDWTKTTPRETEVVMISHCLRSIQRTSCTRFGTLSSSSTRATRIFRSQPPTGRTSPQEQQASWRSTQSPTPLPTIWTQDTGRQIPTRSRQSSYTHKWKKMSLCLKVMSTREDSMPRRKSCTEATG